MLIFTLLIKAAFAGTIVLILSVFAERLSPRIAGVISGAPLGALISYYLLGIEKGIGFVTASIPHAIVGIAGVLIFVITYYAISIRVVSFNALKSTFGGLFIFVVFAFVIREIPFSVLSALPVTIITALIAAFGFRRAKDLHVVEPVRLNFSMLALRAGISAIFVISVVTLGKLLGPIWAGVLIGFPMTWLPTILIIQYTYSRDHAYAMFRGFPLGIGSVLTYLASVSWSFSKLGVHLGTLTSLTLAIGYLFVVTWKFDLKKS
ncbi:MAG: hypothetical protein CMF69_03985 [Magnetovibrio sp.]|nr:hypothetical protein [Magnetovibrio sp.]|tara:strand:+ start:241 stop:1029 length:789 start_codon:yes stop_codon:yes gene_type:complete